MAHKLISKAEAKKLGLPTYDDTPCSKCGHSRRYTNSGKCVDCHTERNKRRNRSKTGNATKSKAVAVAPEPLNGDWRFYSDRITTAWQKAVASILETGKLLIEAKAKVKRGDWGKLVAELPFGERTAERLMEIARHRILSDPTHGSVLPPSCNHRPPVQRYHRHRFGPYVTSGIPVLTLCRKLIEVSTYAPETPLNAYRDDTLCLKVRSIGEAAKLEINAEGTGFRPHRRAGRSPVDSSFG